MPWQSDRLHAPIPPATSAPAVPERKPETAAPAEWGSSGAGSEPETAGDAFESLELFLAMTSLGRKKAGILESFYYDGMSVREIAADRGLSEKAVEGLLRRARDRSSSSEDRQE